MKQTGPFTINHWLTALATVAILAFATNAFAAEKLTIERLGMAGKG